MKLPFNTKQFLDVFRAYNEAIFPTQVLLFGIAILIGYLCARQPRNAGRMISWGLAFLWAWMGIVYHLLFFSRINPGAKIFGALFVLQGILFVWSSSQTNYQLEIRRNWLTVAMWVYALIVYPIIGYFAGHVYPYAPTFGLPCPTTIFTFGVLLLATGKPPWRMLIVPILWALIGTSAFFQLGIIEDLGLPLSAAATLFTFGLKKRKPKKAVQQAT